MIETFDRLIWDKQKGRKAKCLQLFFVVIIVDFFSSTADMMELIRQSILKDRIINHYNELISSTIDTLGKE